MLRVDGVRKTFPRPSRIQRLFVRGAADAPVEVLRGIDIAVDRGEIVGLVGPNGAGKTTLIRTIATVLDPTEGSITVDGFDTQAEPIEVRRRLGLVLADDRALYWRLTGRQNLEFFARMTGLERSAASERIDDLLVRFGLADRDKMVYAYSSGMRARLSIARALVHEPPMLVLDEPTRSLDLVSTREVGQLMRLLAEDGRAILLSSHRVDEIEQLCDRIVVLVDGTAIYDGTVDALSAAERFDEALHELLRSHEEDMR